MSDIRKYINIIESSEKSIQYSFEDTGDYLNIYAILNNETIGEIGCYYDANGTFSDEFIATYNKKNGNVLTSELYIDGISVDGPYRKKGIGSKLIDKAIQFAESKNITVVTLRADGDENYINYLIKYYTNLGFTNIDNSEYAGDETTFYKLLK